MKQVSQVYSGPPASLVRCIGSITGLDEGQAGLLVAMGGAYIGKYRCKEPERLVEAGTQISAYYRLPLTLEPIAFDPAWIVEDNKQFLVAAKPAGIPTQGRRDADYMAFYEILKNNLTGYLGLHHRLDQDTSGLMLFSRSPRMNPDLARAFRERLISKSYLAVAEGAWPFKESRLILEHPIAPERGPHGTRQRVDRSGKPALTLLTRIFQDSGLILAVAQPLTGRTHQIRVHLSHHGMPLWGDALYGSQNSDGFLLHCHRLAWNKVGALPAAEFRCAAPDAWRQRLPKTMADRYRDWLERVC